MSPRRKEKEYRVSVYGEVIVEKRQRVKSYVRAGRPVRGYTRKVVRREERRWDFKGSKEDVRRAVKRVGRFGVAPRRKHLKVRAETYLREPKKWEDPRKPLVIEQEYKKRRFRIRW